MSVSLADVSVYTDFSGLQSISQLGREDSEQGLRKVAEQFEAMFLNMMLKGMRAGEDALFEENFLNSNEMRFHRENLDNQLSLHMASTAGIGLADALHRQLMERYPAELNRAAEKNANSMSGDLSRVRHTSGEIDGKNIRPRPPVSEDASQTFETPQEFVEAMLPLARKVAPQLGVDPRMLVAQAALETGWGKKMIRGEQGHASYNLFGIKAGDSWQGKSINVSTLEFRDGSMQREQAGFRAYQSYEESFADYVKVLQSQPRYSDAIKNASDASAFGFHLQQAGYATDPEYAQKIDRVMQSDVLKTAFHYQAGFLDRSGQFDRSGQSDQYGKPAEVTLQ